MVSLSTWVFYIANKLEYSVSLTYRRYRVGQITKKQVGDNIWKNLLQGKLTHLHWNNGVESAPAIAGLGGALLVRKLPFADPLFVFVGDVVLLKDPEKSGKYLVRRVAAVEGYEMVSKDEKDTPFILERSQCWVVLDESLKSKEVWDSRSFGPVNITDIVGRVIYCLRTAVDHGPVKNSHFGTLMDSSVLAVELDVYEMVKNTKT